MITTGHLCSGYDGIGRGLTQAGLAHRALWHAEYDADASTTLAKHEPGVRNVGDLLAAPWHLASQPDLITAGFPCQPVSGAGRQLADADPRWLWPGVINVIRTVRPGAVFLENVQNIVSIQGGAILRLILGDLREAGYAARWTVMGACAVGAPHHRHRWFLLAANRPGPAPTPEAVRVGGGAVCGAPATGPRRVLPTPAARDGGIRGTPSAEHAARRLADPQRSLNLEDAVSLLPTPTASAYGSNQGGSAGRVGPVRYSLEQIAPDPERWGRYAEAVALWENITGAPAPIPVETGPKGGPRMSALLPEWMMGLPAGTLTGHLPRSAAIKQAGNGVVPQQAAAAWRILTRG